VRDEAPVRRPFVPDGAVLEDLLPQSAVADRSVSSAHILEAVDHGDLADRATDPGVRCAEDERVAARVGDAPYTETLAVDVGTALEEAQCAPVVADLTPGVEMLPGLAIGDAEVAVVEHECGDTRGCE
jgi:hypothetical protein